MVPFEDLETEVNSAVVAALSNRTLIHNGAARVRGRFERNPGDAFGLVQSAAPRFTVLAAAVPGVARGDLFEDDTEVFRVVGVEADGTGLLVLSLEKQA